MQRRPARGRAGDTQGTIHSILAVILAVVAIVALSALASLAAVVLDAGPPAPAADRAGLTRADDGAPRPAASPAPEGSQRH